MRLWGRRRSGQYKPVPHRIHGMTSIDCTPAATAGLRQATTRDWMTPLELTVLGAIWGASFLFMRVAANDFGAVPLVALDRQSVVMGTMVSVRVGLGGRWIIKKK